MPHLPPLPFNRRSLIDYIQSDGQKVDVVVIGGGATGVYTALESASRGYSTVLLERGDFACGTSSASTKLVHGGVRYLRQGRLGLVRESLRERALLRRNAPHIVRPLGIAVPSYSNWHHLKIAAGLFGYSALARSGGFERPRWMRAGAFLKTMPCVEPDELRGGTIFEDGQMDDSRLALAIARTAAEHGAAPVNYVAVREFRTESGRVTGVEAEDNISGESFAIDARVVINATGIYADDTIALGETNLRPTMRWSRGTHIVLDGDLLGGQLGLLIPETRDGRVVFALPWLGKTLVGTTDVDVDSPDSDPRPPGEDVDFLIQELKEYLPAAADSDVISAFTGVRPLVSEDSDASSPRIARSHRITTAPSGLVTAAGGKWTTARVMAEQAISRAAEVGGLNQSRSVSRDLRLFGAPVAGESNPTTDQPVIDPDSLYGSETAELEELERRYPALSAPIHKKLPYRLSHAVFGVRQEMAQTLDDVLERRTRAFPLNRDSAEQAAKSVASAIERHCDVGPNWAEGQLSTISEVSARYRPVD